MTRDESLGSNLGASIPEVDPLLRNELVYAYAEFQRVTALTSNIVDALATEAFRNIQAFGVSAVYVGIDIAKESAERGEDPGRIALAVQVVAAEYSDILDEDTLHEWLGGVYDTWQRQDQ